MEILKVLLIGSSSRRQVWIPKFIHGEDWEAVCNYLVIRHVISLDCLVLHSSTIVSLMDQQPKKFSYGSTCPSLDEFSKLVQAIGWRVAKSFPDTSLACMLSMQCRCWIFSVWSIVYFNFQCFCNTTFLCALSTASSGVHWNPNPNSYPESSAWILHARVCARLGGGGMWLLCLWIVDFR